MQSKLIMPSDDLAGALLKGVRAVTLTNGRARYVPSLGTTVQK